MPYGCIFLRLEPMCRVNDCRCWPIIWPMSVRLASSATLRSFKRGMPRRLNKGQSQPERALADDIGGGVGLHETVTDFSNGTLQQTGNASDVAIDGPGFFCGFEGWKPVSDEGR